MADADQRCRHPWWEAPAAWGLVAGVALAVGALVLVTCGVQIGVFYRAVSWAVGDCE